MLRVDIVVPVKNEAENVRLLTERIDQALKSSKQPYRIIFIDDHSTDGTREVIQQLKPHYPVKIYMKRGKPGKAFSILEAARYIQSEYVVLIDGDLQYPPEVIPRMLAMTAHFQVVIARRQTRHEPPLRQLVSKTFRYVFGQMLFGLNYDIQSGLKVFKSDILPHILPHEVTAWTLDLPLLYTAQQLDYRIGEVEIDFAKRNGGESKIHITKAIKEIAGHGVQFKLRDKRPLTLAPVKPRHRSEIDPVPKLPKRVSHAFKLRNKRSLALHSGNLTSMLGAGLLHKHQKFITHTTLSHHDHALQTITVGQRLALFALALCQAPLFVDTESR
jgi:glycosyltransferase involved in cell wall biosynthesis